MRFHKIMRHTDGRSRDIYDARGWGKTRSNFFISIIGPLMDEEPRLHFQELFTFLLNRSGVGEEAVQAGRQVI